MPLSAKSVLLLSTAALLPLAGCGKHARPAEPAGAPKPLVTDASMQVGGEDVVTIERTPAETTAKPEFVSATILPGRGFNLFQVTANLPGKGEVKLLASPSIEEAASRLNGGPGDAEGTGSISFGGGFLVPYPNRILGKLSADAKTIQTSWQGHTLNLPADWSGKKPGAQKHSIHGLILASKVDNIQRQKTEDGETVTGILHAGDFGGRWLSKTDLKFSVALSADAVIATITATNVGSVAEPMAIGWHPYFAIPSGDRKQARLHIPASRLAEVTNYDDTFPTGKIVPVAGTKYDFTDPGGKPLAEDFLDDNFSDLTRTDGAVNVELTDPAFRYGIRVKGLAPEIKTVQVYAPPAKSFAAIEEQFNFADPFGKEWNGADTGMVTLQPGKSVTWKVRLELFTPPAPATAQDPAAPASAQQ